MVIPTRHTVHDALARISVSLRSACIMIATDSADLYLYSTRIDSYMHRGACCNPHSDLSPLTGRLQIRICTALAPRHRRVMIRCLKRQARGRAGSVPSVATRMRTRATYTFYHPSSRKAICRLGDAPSGAGGADGGGNGARCMPRAWP